MVRTTTAFKQALRTPWSALSAACPGSGQRVPGEGQEAWWSGRMDAAVCPAPGNRTLPLRTMGAECGRGLQAEQRAWSPVPAPVWLRPLRPGPIVWPVPHSQEAARANPEDTCALAALPDLLVAFPRHPLPRRHIPGQWAQPVGLISGGKGGITKRLACHHQGRRTRNTQAVGVRGHEWTGSPGHQVAEPQRAPALVTGSQRLKASRLYTV